MSFKIPIAHIHGGELTEGVIDESIRHSITKMSHIHFAATNDYKKKSYPMGEDPSRVFQFGGLGIDNIKKLELLSKDDLEKKLNFTFGDKNLLATFHPETLENRTSEKKIDELLAAIAYQDDMKVIFTLPNADYDGRIIFSKISDFCKNNPSRYSF